MTPRLPRDCGITIGSLPPGPHNAITDVAGARVGHVTLHRGDGALRPGDGPVRTGVTAVWPGTDRPYQRRVTAAAHVINGYGKSTGLIQVEELGQLETPVLLTGTLNVPRAADALISYMVARHPGIAVTRSTVNPVVLECSDQHLNDAQGRHVGADEVEEALEAAGAGQVAQGAVGAGTGMVAFGHKGGIGTASRRLDAGDGAGRPGDAAAGRALGVLVLANHGRRRELVVDGVPAGQRLAGRHDEDAPAGGTATRGGSVIVVLATDAPLSSLPLRRAARRATAGLARTGSHLHHGSGDIVLAFTTAAPLPPPEEAEQQVRERPQVIDGTPAFRRLLCAVVETTEEAILNALFAAETATGRDGHTVPGLPVDTVVEMWRDG